jgi:hypothetical protein
MKALMAPRIARKARIVTPIGRSFSIYQSLLEGRYYDREA